MQRATVVPCCDFAVRSLGLPHGQVVGKRNDAMQPFVVPVEAVEVETCQLDRRNLTRAYQRRKFGDGEEGQLLVGRRGSC